jgi:L-lactate dehydrogenase complex protein LldG
VSGAREEILTRVRDALRATATDIPVAREYRVGGGHAPGSAVLDLLVDRPVEYRAVVHTAGSHEIAAAVATILAGAGSVVVPDGLDRRWLADLPASTTIVNDSRTDPRTADELDHVDAVVTAARVAVADTGTIVLDGEPDQGRRAISLVPDLHVCVVRRDQVVQTVPEAVRALGTYAARPQTWISGPSATSDIELTRVEGVHGPRTLHVVLVR